MGNMCSVSIPIEDTISTCSNCFAKHAKYALKLNQNAAALRTAMEELTGVRNDVQRRVDLAERQQMKRLDQVQGWLSRVQALETEVDGLLLLAHDHHHANQNIVCPNCYNYKLGKMVARKLKDAAALTSKGLLFEAVADKILPSPGVERPVRPTTVGMESIFSEVWTCLIGDDKVGVIALYGQGGVGKTTLMTKINNELAKTSTPDAKFDHIIWVLVSRTPHLEKIQDEIWKAVASYDESWARKIQEDKANDIYGALKKKRFVLLLDDLWDRLDLLKVGVPLPDHENKSKVVFTTRSEVICGSMEADRSVKVECLDWGKAWDLFKSKVGEDTLNIHPEIPELAKLVARECHGLPLALITTGRAMACKKTVKEWRYAANILKTCALDFPGMQEEVFPLLKFSYDSLPSERIRSCFLSCLLFPVFCGGIRLDILIDFWIGEGLLDESSDMDQVSQGHNIIAILLHACLLEKKGEHFVTMHDVIHDMALWIACDCGRVKDKVLSRVGVGLTEIPHLARWTEAERISLMYNKIEKLEGAPHCPNLSCLLLDRNHLGTIDEGFFKFMPSLRVLSLARNRGMTKLPSELSNLVMLQYVDLSYTSIRSLPVELKNLIQLKCLMLDFTRKLCMFPEHLISSLAMLQVFRISDTGFSDCNQFMVQELDCLKGLNFLRITINSVSALQLFLSSKRLPGCTQGLCLRVLQGLRALNISALANIEHLDTFHVSNCDSLEDLVMDRERERKENELQNSRTLTSQSFFGSLICVKFENCQKLKDLTGLLFAPNLLYLVIIDCWGIEEIVHEGDWVETVPLAKLVKLHLLYLPKLKTISRKALPFRGLTSIHVLGCTKLKKIPIRSDGISVGHQITICGEEEWLNELQWEDETARDAFHLQKCGVASMNTIPGLFY